MKHEFCSEAVMIQAGQKPKDWVFITDETSKAEKWTSGLRLWHWRIMDTEAAVLANNHYNKVSLLHISSRINLPPPKVNFKCSDGKFRIITIGSHVTRVDGHWISTGRSLEAVSKPPYRMFLAKREGRRQTETEAYCRGCAAFECGAGQRLFSDTSYELMV